jgi:hypothetical protein
MAAAAPIIALGLSVGGQIFGGIQANNAAREAAKVDQRNAQKTLLEGEEQGLQTRKDERMQAGEMIAALGGAGTQLGTGTASDLISQSAYDREVEILNIRTRAAQQANNLFQSAKDKQAAGRNQLIQSLFGAVSSAIGGVSNIKGQNALQGQQATENQYQLGGGATAYSPAPAMRVKGGY